MSRYRIDVEMTVDGEETTASYKGVRYSSGSPDYCFLGDDEYFIFESIKDAEEAIENYLTYEMFLNKIMIVNDDTEEVVSSIRY